MTGNSTRRPVRYASRLVDSTRRLARSGWAILLISGSILLGVSSANAYAGEQNTTNSLKSVEFAGLPGNKAQIVLTLSNTATSPLSFTIDNPARIALDFPATKNELAQRTQSIGIGMADSMTAIEAQGRTRVVFNLVEMVPYEAHTEGNKVVLTIQGGGKEESAASAAVTSAKGGTRPPAISHGRWSY